ncbi:MAG: VWA domain-containing protein [Anaerolineales bacterium]
MTFIWPTLLLLLLVVPLLIGLYIRMQLRRRQIAANLGSLGFMQAAEGGQLGWRRHIPQAIFLVGLAIMVVALARPETVVSLPRREGTVILAFDVSGSMAAEDMQPTRMEAAKAAARDFVQRQPTSVQIGVVAFSDGGIAVQAPTNDQEAILASIERLAPQRGTSIGHGILASLNEIAVNAGEDVGSPGDPTPMPTPTPVPKGTYMPAVIVLLTDGENTQSPDPLAAAQAAADRGVRIYTIGIGSTTGITLQVNGCCSKSRSSPMALISRLRARKICTIFTIISNHSWSRGRKKPKSLQYLRASASSCCCSAVHFRFCGSAGCHDVILRILSRGRGLVAWR